jgi:hypothetical protein
VARGDFGLLSRDVMAVTLHASMLRRVQQVVCAYMIIRKLAPAGHRASSDTGRACGRASRSSDFLMDHQIVWDAVE